MIDNFLSFFTFYFSFRSTASVSTTWIRACSCSFRSSSPHPEDFALFWTGAGLIQTQCYSYAKKDIVELEGEKRKAKAAKAHYSKCLATKYLSTMYLVARQHWQPEAVLCFFLIWRSNAMADVQFYNQDEFGEEQERERLLKTDQELDGIHDGLIFPTKDERLTLRRVPDSIPWNAYCKLWTNFLLLSPKHRPKSLG